MLLNIDCSSMKPWHDVPGIELKSIWVKYSLQCHDWAELGILQNLKCRLVQPVTLALRQAKRNWLLMRLWSHRSDRYWEWPKTRWTEFFIRVAAKGIIIFNSFIIEIYYHTHGGQASNCEIYRLTGYYNFGFFISIVKIFWTEVNNFERTLYSLPW